MINLCVICGHISKPFNVQSVSMCSTTEQAFFFPSHWKLRGKVKLKFQVTISNFQLAGSNVWLGETLSETSLKILSYWVVILRSDTKILIYAWHFLNPFSVLETSFHRNPWIGILKIKIWKFLNLGPKRALIMAPSEYSEHSIWMCEFKVRRNINNYPELRGFDLHGFVICLRPKFRNLTFKMNKYETGSKKKHILKKYLWHNQINCSLTHVNKQISEMKTFSALQCLIHSFILQVPNPPWLHESESQSVCSPLNTYWHR